MRAFVSMRHYLINNAGLINRLSNVEAKDLEQDQRLLAHDRKLDEVFEAMDRGELKAKGLFYNNQQFLANRVLRQTKFDIAEVQPKCLRSKNLMLMFSYADSFGKLKRESFHRQLRR